MKSKYLSFEDMSYYPMFKKKKNFAYRDDKYVKVRLLCSKDLPVDFNTGIIDPNYFEKPKTELDLDSIESKPSWLR